LEAVEPASCSVEDRRIELRRGALTEWYVNDERGVEQGFTIAEPPGRDGAGANEPVRLDLSFPGRFEANVLPGERDVVFASADRRTAIHYRGLRAWDAEGRELDTRLAVEGRTLSILVDDRDAVHPLTVDPWVWIEEDALWASDGENWDQLGIDVSLDGDTALVGAWSDADMGAYTGAAYVFERSVGGWSEQAKLQANDMAGGDMFAHSVALDGDTAVSGASGDTDFGGYSGSAYVFQRSGTSWHQEAKVFPSDPQVDGLFGWEVDLDGDTMLVGAPGADSAVGQAEGAAYVFTRSGTIWTQQAKLDAASGVAQEQIGSDVALDGDTALLAADYSAYVFVRTGTTWTEQAELPACCTMYGTTVALSGDTALVATGLPATVYIYVRTGSAWSLQTAFLENDPPDYSFGKSVAIDGDLALIGGTGTDCGDYGEMGAAILFERTGVTWAEKARIAPGCFEDKTGGFATSLDLDGETVLIGDPGAFQVADYYLGAAFVYAPGAEASATFRNAGANPASYDAVWPPKLGYYYRGTVDLAGTTGHVFAWLVGYAGPTTLALGGGQVLLVDVSAAGGELLGEAMQPGPIATFDVLVPFDLTFLGFEASTQALHFGGGVTPFALSNAQDLFAGH